MFANRISEMFQLAPATKNATASPIAMATVAVAQLLPVVSVQDIYQMAAAKARYDYELDKLFNPEYYGDGAGHLSIATAHAVFVDRVAGAILSVGR